MEVEITEKKFKVTIDTLNSIWHRSSAEIVGAKDLEDAQKIFNDYLMWGKVPSGITIPHEDSQYLYDTVEQINEKENTALSNAEHLLPDDNYLTDDLVVSKEFPEELNYEFVTDEDRKKLLNSKT